MVSTPCGYFCSLRFKNISQGLRSLTHSLPPGNRSLHDQYRLSVFQFASLLKYQATFSIPAREQQTLHQGIDPYRISTRCGYFSSLHSKNLSHRLRSLPASKTYCSLGRTNTKSHTCVWLLVFVLPAGIEPATFSLKGSCSTG